MDRHASDVGVGAVLCQEFEGEGRLPIAYASKKLLPSEKNYTIEKVFGNNLGNIEISQISIWSRVLA